MNRKILRNYLISVFFCFFLCSGTSLWSQSFFNGNIEISYRTDIIDLRPEYNMNRSGDGKNIIDYSAEELNIGTIFIAPSGDLREVTDIYDSNGSTVIETSEPEITDAFRSLDIPEFRISISRDDFIELGEGVTLLTEEEAEDPSNYLSSEYDGDRGFWKKVKNAVKNVGEAIVDTVEDVVDFVAVDGDFKISTDTPLTFNIDKTLYQKKTSSSKFGITNGSVKLKGTLTADIELYGYYKINCAGQTWATAKLTVDQAIHADVIGEVSNYFYRSFYIGEFKKGLYCGKLYVTVNAAGNVELTIRLRESTKITVGAKKEKEKLKPIWNASYDLGFKPELEGHARVKSGPKVVGSFELLGVELSSASLLTGLGVDLDGYVGAKGYMGVNQNGKYTAGWDVKAKAKIFAYIETYVTLLKKINIPVYSKNFTIKTWSN